jgi:hypothetical protein
MKIGDRPLQGTGRYFGKYPNNSGNTLGHLSLCLQMWLFEDEKSAKTCQPIANQETHLTYHHTLHEARTIQSISS